ncbi:MAG: 4Fe-4S dicluster domain-containing protein [Candidatus Kariarchaeaceae archaeon]
MALEVKSSLIHELKNFGLDTTEICYNCGFCAATCSQSGNGKSSYRKAFRLLQLGLKDLILQNKESLVCYMCDDCGASCPLGNDVAKTLMALRLWVEDQEKRN